MDKALRDRHVHIYDGLLAIVVQRRAVLIQDTRVLGYDLAIGQPARLIGTKENEVLRQLSEHGPLKPVRLVTLGDSVRVLRHVAEALCQPVQEQEVDDVPDLYEREFFFLWLFF